MRHFIPLLLLSVLALPQDLTAQESYPTKFSPGLATVPAVRDALQYVDDNFDSQVSEWVRITEIPAKSEHEQQRGAYVREQFENLGYEVSVDSIGNVVAKRPGTGGGPTLVFAAHMDTVHPMDTDVTVRQEAGRLFAPGVFDNSNSVANMIAAARALEAAQLGTKGDVIFIGTVQEEIGLRGMAYWLDHNPGVTDMLIAIDGGLGAVSYGALGIYWSRMVFSGEGSHTNSSRGKPHPARAAAQCITDIYDIPLPAPDAPVSAVYNVGMLRGGHVVNAIAQEVSFTVDLRTVDPALLAVLDTAIVNTCTRVAQEHRVGFERQWIQRNEAGGRPEDLEDRRRHPIVQTAVDVLEHLGWDFRGRQPARASGSTDSNAGVTRGIPSISIGRSIGADQHTLQEWAEIEPARMATKQIVLLVAALAELTEGAD
jgi:acetylornithine deacetylase/succinyl-diaminopimelate desuccinylase-like protein